MEKMVLYKPQDISTAESLAILRLDKSVPHYRNIPKDKRVSWLIERIAQANLLRHQKVDGLAQVLEMDALALDAYIMENIYYSDFTLNEIEEAIRMGLVGKYGEYYGINAISLYGFIEGFFKSEKKQKAIKLVQAQRKREQREQYEREQREKARLEGWGVPMKTVTQEEINNVVKSIAKK